MFLLAAFLGLSAAVSSVQAQTPASLSYQGYLETAGHPVTDPSATLTFRLFADPTGGSVLWTEMHTGVAIANGLFTTDLGMTTPMGPELFYGPLYLSVAVGGTAAAQLAPRSALRSAPYARTLVAPAQIFGQDVGALLSVQNIESGSSGTGLYAETSASEGRAVYGLAGAGSGVNAGVFGQSESTDGYGVYGTGPNAGVRGASLNTGVYGSGNLGVLGIGDGTGISGQGDDYGVRGASVNIGIRGEGNSQGVVGTASSALGVGVSGEGPWQGVLCMGTGTESSGVTGLGNRYGVAGNSPLYGIYGTTSLGSSGYAGYFNGRVNVTGVLTKGGGAFEIDHPLDPAGRILRHSFVESPDMMNVYNGNTTTDAQGYATVTLPDYFEALNRDARYQLTCIGQFAQAIVAERVQGNRFVIQTDKPNVEVSWQVTGIRQDGWANANRIDVEEDKPAGKRGRYLHPAAFGLSREQGIDYDAAQEAQMEQARAAQEAAPPPPAVPPSGNH
jgi:hypothetical protein